MIAVQCWPVLCFQPLPPPSGHLVPPRPKSLLCFLLASFCTGSGICCLCFLKPEITHLPIFNLPQCIAISHLWWSPLLFLMLFPYFHEWGAYGTCREKCMCSNSPGLSRNHLLLEFVLVYSGYYNNNTIHWVDYKQHTFIFHSLVDWEVQGPAAGTLSIWWGPGFLTDGRLLSVSSPGGRDEGAFWGLL